MRLSAYKDAMENVLGRPHGLTDELIFCKHMIQAKATSVGNGGRSESLTAIPD